jgi:hypothetical protein
MSPVLMEAAPTARLSLGTPAFDAVMALPEHQDLRAFYAYWQSRCGGERAPLRADIDPIDIPRLLPNVLLIDVIGQPAYDFHYRLLGTAIVEVDGVDYKGSHLSEMVPSTEAFHHIWQHHLNASAGMVELRRDSLRWVHDNSRDHVDYFILLLPLRRAGNEIETLFGYVHYRLDDPHRPWSL